MTLFEDGKSLGTVRLAYPAMQPLRWQLPTSGYGDKRLTIVTNPPRRGGPGENRVFGIAVESLGYLSM